jgi:hypothetical protein
MTAKNMGEVRLRDARSFAVARHQGSVIRKP